MLKVLDRKTLTIRSERGALRGVEAVVVPSKDFDEFMRLHKYLVNAVESLPPESMPTPLHCALNDVHNFEKEQANVN